MAEFLVLDKAPNYNAILGRGTLNEIRAAISTCNLTIRFPTPMALGRLKETKWKQDTATLEL